MYCCLLINGAKAVTIKISCKICYISFRIGLVKGFHEIFHIHTWTPQMANVWWYPRQADWFFPLWFPKLPRLKVTFRKPDLQSWAHRAIWCDCHKTQKTDHPKSRSLYILWRKRQNFLQITYKIERHLQVKTINFLPQVHMVLEIWA